MPTVVERSVIDMGQGSYVITLSKAWCRFYRIRPREKLTIVTDGDLIISRKRRRGELKRDKRQETLVRPSEEG